MACRFDVTLSGADARHVGAAREALAEAGRLEAALTVFRDDSDLMAVNRGAAAAPVAVSGELLDLLSHCLTLYRETDGAFDITSTPLSRCWGFLARAPRVPAESALAAARACVGAGAVQMDAASSTVTFARQGVELNLGSIGKGYAVARIAGVLRAAGVRHALVSAAGSSAAAVGGRDGGWTIDLVSRLTRRGRIARIRLRDGALATSGAGEQSLIVDGVRYGHVIDPRTGRPARGVLSATVVTDDAAAADALSTAFLIGGPPLAERCCASRPDTLALLTLDDDEQRTRIFGGFPRASVEDV